ncbi:uncharacterized protein LOC114330381 [Diabrotica virgifera virgifera]|uniref:alpha-glucosidase n=1 Tax=Diabrotica virgifera virgifera TaxID=50390 RepID=A0A6P7FRA3_DIAVI|nr:uncharacterized protein LOC114330381 [Diabrotica virgifera virgifera]
MNGNSKSEDKKESPGSGSYKPVPNKEMEVLGDTVIRSKAGSKSNNKETDGADERMLPKEDTKVSPKSEISLKDVKIVMGEKNGDAKLDIVEPKATFGGMTKEELMKYANDPFWVRLRWFLFVTFWLLWAAMLIGAIMIIYAAPKCDPPPPRTWWQVGPLATLDPDAKPESLNSLNKDIKGVIIVWPEDSYKPFDETHNTIQLIKKGKELGTKIIVDLDPAATDLWYAESENSSETFSDYYIWQPPSYENGVKLTPPNNWNYLNKNSSWEYSNVRKLFYYAPLGVPHLNFRKEAVIDEFSKVIKKFIGHGASGIRIRNAPLLLVDPKFESEGKIGNKDGVVIGDPGFFTPTKTMNLLDLGKLLLNWKEVVRNNTVDGLLMVAEELGKIQSYQVNDSLVVDLPLMTNVFSKPNVTTIVNRLNHTFKIDNVKWPLWKETSSSLPPDVVSIVTSLLPGASLVKLNDTIDHQLLQIRESPSIMRGNCDMYAVSNDTVFAFVREISGNPGVLVLLNTGDQKVTLNVKQNIAALSDLDEVTIQYYSKNYNETTHKDINAKKDSTDIPISPKSVLVLQYVPKKKQ